MSEKFWQLAENEDVRRYVNFVSYNGNSDSDLYSYMKSECENYGVSYDSRAEVRVGMLKVFFSGNGHKSPTKTLFKKLFPTINQLFEEIKSINKNLLACLLQSIESQTVLTVITKKISRECPKAPLFTIHDSIATTVSYKNVVERIMREELEKLTGYPPKLKIEYWRAENLDWTKYR